MTAPAIWPTVAGDFEPDLEETAFHEAGHFVARHALLPHLGFQAITVQPGKPAAGSPFAKLVGACQEFMDPTEGPDGVQYCEACAIGLFAGYAAQVRFRAASEERARIGARHDFAMAIERVRRLYPGQPSAELLAKSSRLLLDAAHQLMGETWTAVEALAHALARDLTLDGMRARQIVAASEEDTESMR